jgi:predicted membrane channel-forming protein YqfA (hemolysin III family)
VYCEAKSVDIYLKAARWLAIFLFIAAAVFFLFAVFNRSATANPVVVGLLALTWLLFGGLLLWVTRRISQYMAERGESFDFEFDLSAQFKRKNKKREPDL